MATPESTFIQSPTQAYPDRATVPRVVAASRTWPWHRLALGGVLIVAAIMNFWRLNSVGYGNSYYAAAIKSMLQSWHNFFFVSFDPGGFVTIDKPPLGFWIQTASAKLFGFSGVSILLPEALAGVLSVAVLYRLVARTWGRDAGLLAALFLAVTPVSVITSRNNTIDSLLVLTVLLAAWAVMRAAETGRLRWLHLCAVLVGLGFNIKMLEAYLVVPAFGLMYLLGARTGWRRRIGHLALAVVVLLGVSLSWATAVDLTPASARPYVGSSGTNSELNLALGYNGLQRLTGTLFGHGGAAARSAGTSAASAASHVASTAAPGGPGGPGGNGNALFNGGAAGPFRLLGTTLGGQVSWLLVLAVLGLVLAATRVPWRRLSADSRGRALVLWGAWLLTAGAFFSVAEFFHPYYTVMLAPAVAALAAIGVASLWEAYRDGDRRGWLLPVVLLASACAEAYILRDYPAWSGWLTPIVIGAGVLGAVALVVARMRPRKVAWIGLAGLGLAVTGLLAAPTAWAAYSVENGTNATIPTAGPSAQSDSRLSGGPFGNRTSTPQRAIGAPGAFGTGQSGQPPAGGPGGGSAPGGMGGPGGDGQTNTALIRYLEAHQGSATYLVATPSSQGASSIIIATGKSVMALGGFSGSDQILTTSQLAALVKAGTVRYFLLQGDMQPGQGGGVPSQILNSLPAALRKQAEAMAGRGFGGGGPGGQNSALTQWVSAYCTTVPSSQWQSAPATQSGGNGGFSGGQQLYDCASRPARGSSASTGSGRSAAASAQAVARPTATATAPQAAATTTRSTQTTAPATTPGASTAPATSSKTAPTRGGSSVMGQWVADTSGALTLQSFQGTQSVSTTAQTRYYRVTASAARALAVGERVTVALTASAQTAAGIAVLPAGAPTIVMHGMGTGGPGGAGAAPPAAPGSPGNAGGSGSTGNAGAPGGPAPGASGAPPAGGSQQPALSGTITSVMSTSLTLKTATGATRTVKLASSTAIYRVSAATWSQFQSRTFVVAGTTTVSGRQVAAYAVDSLIAGAMPAVQAA